MKEIFLNIPYEGKASDVDKKINGMLSEKNIKIYQTLFDQPKYNGFNLI